MFSASLHVFLLLFFLQLVHATIFVTAPLDTTTCQGGQSCQVQWVDNGEAPFLTTIGPCYVGLFNGNGVLVQQIEPVDVSSVHSLQFTPDPSAGPDSHGYYINFTSVDPIGTPSAHYVQYSPFFALTGMSGSLQSPIASDTSTLPVPSTVASAPSNTIISTISVGNTISSSGATPASSASSISASVTSPVSVSTGSATASSSQSTLVSESSTPSSLSSSGSSGFSNSFVSSTSSTFPTSSSLSTSSGSSSFITSRTPSSAASSSSTSASTSPSASTSATSGASRSIATRSAPYVLLVLFGCTIAIALF